MVIGVTVDNASLMGRNANDFAPIQSAFLTAAQLLEAGRASLLLRESSDQILTVSASLGIEPFLASTIRVPYGQGVAGLVAERGVALFGRVDGQTFLCVPVITDQGVEGALNVTDRQGGKQYTPAHIEQAQSAAKHIADLLIFSRFAAKDPVSGLANRRAFDEMLARELAFGDRTGSHFCVVFLDLDNFKAVNDRHGHTQGDAVLRAVGEALHQTLRQYDFAGRYGGDEFALLLPGTGEEVGGIADRIMETIAGLTSQLGVSVAVSVGLAYWPEDGTTAAQLLGVADRRMYEHKRAKKARAIELLDEASF